MRQDLIFQVAIIPTLTEGYLGTRTLGQCVQVCRSWYEALLPQLWRSFGDGLYGSWATRLEAATRGRQPIDDGQDIDWFLEVYRRHAKYIRRLEINHPLTLCFLVQDGFRVPPAPLSLALSPDAIVVADNNEGDGGSLSAMQLEHVQVYISWRTIRRYFRHRPIAGVRGSNYQDPYMNSDSEAEEDIANAIAATATTNNNCKFTICTTDDVIAEALWRLALGNPGLQSIGLRQDFKFFRQLLEEFPTALGSVRRITSLQLVQGRLPRLPPNVTSVHATYDTQSQYSREEAPGPVHEGVEEATVELVRYVGQVRRLLVQLPNLRKLHLKHLRMRLEADDNPEEMAEKKLEAEEGEGGGGGVEVIPISKVRILTCDHSSDSSPGIERLLRSMPLLVEFHYTRWSHRLATTLVATCPLIEVVRITVLKGLGVDRKPRQSIQDNVSILLTSCPKLRVVEMWYEYVDVRNVLQEEKGKQWVCQGLEELRCQFVGVPYLTDEEQATLDRMLAREQGCQSSPSLSLESKRSAEEEELYERKKLATSIHKEVFGRLSRLTRLKYLSLSPDLKLGVDFVKADMYSLIYRSKVDGMHYINYGDVLPDTLNLRLDCGLDQLASLTELEFLGFESVDHRMRAQDIEWIAEHFRKLREMRGLALDTHVGVEDNLERDALRKLLQTLRPDIVHTESS
ncbi:hypothetical protein BGX33_005072 [Mortierella sp. NVP41]|nr:hypothetical protein BGX33_005072 [Mortierella sp. NVP41]